MHLVVTRATHTMEYKKEEEDGRPARTDGTIENVTINGSTERDITGAQPSPEQK